MIKNNNLNAFTVDVEDYFQVEAFSSLVEFNDWGKFESRVVKNTHIILDLLDQHNVKGTFFVLGWVAKKHPYLVKEIAIRGHEVASHGMTHKLIYNQKKEIFKNETFYSKKLLEDLSQQSVNGYRAATYSIINKSLWALDILVEAGFKYDSSIFPMRHDRYGIPDANPVPHVLTTPNGSEIIEFPISTYKTKYFTLPVAGGGYFRLFPYFLTKWGLRSINEGNTPFVFYIHPWEVDPEQPKIENTTMLTKFRHYINLSKTKHRLDMLCHDFKMAPIKDVLKELDLLTDEHHKE